MQDNDRFVDELLDSALAHQRGVEPRVGFEGRILARVRAASTQKSRKGFWLTTAATASAVAMFVAIYVANRSHRPAGQTSQAVNALPAASPSETPTAISEAAPKAGPVTNVIEPKRIARRERKPSPRVEAHHWPSQFPTPAPLSKEEKALIQYVRETPPEEMAASLFKEQPADQPMEIKPLEIAPLVIPRMSMGPAKEEIQ